MFNVIRKSNNAVINSFNSEEQAKTFLEAMGPQRNFMKIVDVSESSVVQSAEVSLEETLSRQLTGVIELLSAHPEFVKNDDVLANVKTLVKLTKGKSDARKAGKSDLSQKILNVLSGASNNQSSCSDIAKTLVADGVFETQQIAIKKVSDRCWLMERQGLLVKVEKGVYKTK